MTTLLRDEISKALDWHRAPGGMRPNHPPDLAGCPVSALREILRMLDAAPEGDIAAALDAAGAPEASTLAERVKLLAEERDEERALKEKLLDPEFVFTGDGMGVMDHRGMASFGARHRLCRPRA